MARIQLIDTSILVEVLRVPGMCQRHDDVMAELRVRQEQGVQFVLPIAAVIETGNFVAQIHAGAERRHVARSFETLLTLVADGKAPWVLLETAWDAEFLRCLVRGCSTGTTLAEHADARSLGCGDLTILAEADALRARSSKGTVVDVWTLDEQLNAYQRPG